MDWYQNKKGPFEVVKRVGQVACRLRLSERLKIHSTFHVGFLKPFSEDLADKGSNKPSMLHW